MPAKAGFERVTEVTEDDRSRSHVRRVGVRCDGRFLVSRRESGEIQLTPLTSIPKRDLLTWENDELPASLLRGLGDAADDRVEPLDDRV